MRAYIKIWKNEYLLTAINWHRDGSIAFVTFRDENGVLHVINQKYSDSNTDAEMNRDEEIKHADLEHILLWKKITHVCKRELQK